MFVNVSQKIKLFTIGDTDTVAKTEAGELSLTLTHSGKATRIVKIKALNCELILLSVVNKTKAATRAFSVAAPSMWNSLPANVKLEGNNI